MILTLPQWRIYNMIDWKKALKAGWEESKKQPFIDGPEKWALYFCCGFIILMLIL